MGVVNATPDSFSDGGQFHQLDSAVAHALQLVDEGADILDIGGESTRPGAEKVSLKEELNRVVPVIQKLREKGCKAAISIDTFKPEVMQAAIDAGADMVNDVTGMENPEARKVVAKADVPVCIMHMSGDPQTMQKNPSYDDVVAEVSAYLVRMVELCQKDGIKKENVILDPGIGFGKQLAHNLTLLAATKSICELGYPILIGVSRKSFIDHLLDRPVNERLAGSLGAGLYTAMQGASILRVHDVRETHDAIRMAEAIQSI